MGREVLGGGWCTIEGLNMGYNFFARRRIWDEDFAKHMARFLGTAGIGIGEMRVTTFDFFSFFCGFSFCFLRKCHRSLSWVFRSLKGQELQ
jgi:hypothetical protein